MSYKIKLPDNFIQLVCEELGEKSNYCDFGNIVKVKNDIEKPNLDDNITHKDSNLIIMGLSLAYNAESLRLALSYLTCRGLNTYTGYDINLEVTDNASEQEVIRREVKAAADYFRSIIDNFDLIGELLPEEQKEIKNIVINVNFIKLENKIADIFYWGSLVVLLIPIYCLLTMYGLSLASILLLLFISICFYKMQKFLSRIIINLVRHNYIKSLDKRFSTFFKNKFKKS